MLAAAKAEEFWNAAYTEPEFAPCVSSLCVAYLPHFGIDGAVLLARLFKAHGTVLLRLDSEGGDEFTMMVGMGFFVPTGDRYQMVIPPELTIEKVRSAARAYAETEDDRYALHPERLVKTMSSGRAEQWQRWLR